MSEFFLMLFDLFYFHWAVDNGLLYLISVPPPLSKVEDVPFLPALKIKDKNKIAFTPEDFQNIRVLPLKNCFTFKEFHILQPLKGVPLVGVQGFNLTSSK